MILLQQCRRSVSGWVGQGGFGFGRAQLSGGRALLVKSAGKEIAKGKEMTKGKEQAKGKEMVKGKAKAAKGRRRVESRPSKNRKTPMLARDMPGDPVVVKALKNVKKAKLEPLTKDLYGMRVNKLNQYAPVEMKWTDLVSYKPGSRAKETYKKKTKPKQKPLVNFLRKEPVYDICDETYRLARSMNRKFIFHMGPTNSGKTHHAFQRFLTSETGSYLGPLRLLAWEIGAKAIQEGVACDVITGEEKRLAYGTVRARHMACTMEMMNPNKRVEVGVIDEIQMLCDESRGDAWVNALMGMPADEIHLCGEPRTLPVILRLLNMTGEAKNLEVKEYRRLSELNVSKTIFPFPTQMHKGAVEEDMMKAVDIRKGDCFVCFNIREIYRVKELIEKHKGMNCITIYGSLPPETRILAARKFNDPDNNFNVLVATDAIGLGLNLNIQRVIFTTVKKFDVAESCLVNIDSPHCKQIAGRAGRFSSEFSAGEVSAMGNNDLKFIRNVMNNPLQEVLKCHVGPSKNVLSMIDSQAKAVEEVLSIFKTLRSRKTHGKKTDLENFFLPAHGQIREETENILSEHTIRPSLLFELMKVPFKVKKGNMLEKQKLFVVMFVEAILYDLEVTLKPFLDHFPIVEPHDRPAVQFLEVAHQQLDIYLWLSNKFPKNFPDSRNINQYRIAIGAALGRSMFERELEPSDETILTE
eukprot:Nk52_evm80s1073 gene=Nk52_evmTU80s1073